MVSIGCWKEPLGCVWASASVGVATSLSCKGMPDEGLLEHTQVHNQALGLLSNNIIGLSLCEHPSLRSSFLLTAAL